MRLAGGAFSSFLGWFLILVAPGGSTGVLVGAILLNSGDGYGGSYPVGILVFGGLLGVFFSWPVILVSLLVHRSLLRRAFSPILVAVLTACVAVVGSVGLIFLLTIGSLPATDGGISGSVALTGVTYGLVGASAFFFTFVLSILSRWWAVP